LVDTNLTDILALTIGTLKHGKTPHVLFTSTIMASFPIAKGFSD
jgi:hypothetical protein